MANKTNILQLSRIIKFFCCFIFLIFIEFCHFIWYFILKNCILIAIFFTGVFTQQVFAKSKFIFIFYVIIKVTTLSICYFIIVVVHYGGTDCYWWTILFPRFIKIQNKWYKSCTVSSVDTVSEPPYIWFLPEFSVSQICFLLAVTRDAIYIRHIHRKRTPAIYTPFGLCYSFERWKVAELMNIITCRTQPCAAAPRTVCAC